MKNLTATKLLNDIRTKLNDCFNSITLRSEEHPNAFTRSGGKLGAFITVFLILRGMKSSLQSTLDGFFRELCEGEMNRLHLTGQV